MKHKIWKKEDFFLISDERIDMDPAVVELVDGIPLVWNFDFNRAPYAWVNDIELIDGEIIGEVEWIDPHNYEQMIKDGDIRLGGYYTQVEKSEDGATVIKCLLKGASLVVSSSMPNAHWNPGANPPPTS